MSNIKVDVQWSPVDEDIFITSSTALTLYQVLHDEVTKDQSPDSRKNVSPDGSRRVVLDSKPQHQMKHVAWYPKADRRNVFAVAQANGRIAITGFGHQADELIGKEFNVRVGQKSNNYLAWNPVESNLLAQGFEKNRSDACVLIWDVLRESGLEMSERTTRHSFSEGPVVKPYAEIGFGDSSCSFSWFPNIPFNFVTGNANKHLRIYDLRDPTKFQTEANHRCVYGLAIDPLDMTRMASFSENQVAVWDIRSFDRPINVITENKTVTKMAWCPTKLGMLAVLCKDTSYIKLHDIRHTLFGSDDIEQVSMERKIQPSKSNLSSFAWHPKQENRLMTVQPNSILKDMVFFERLPVKWSSGMKMVMRVDKAVMNCAEDSVEEDVTFAMRRRLRLNYGQDPQNLYISMKAIENEPHLHGLWKWIYNVKSVLPRLEASLKRKLSPAEMGIMSILRLDKDDLKSEAVPTNWRTSQGAKYSKRTMYKSEARSLALRICRWSPDPSLDSLKGFSNGAISVERSAAMDIFYLAIDSALKTLSDSSGSGCNTPGDKTSLQAVAMALSGYTEEKDTLWQKTCGGLRTKLDNPYLRAIFTFLACEEDNYEEVLKHQDLPLGSCDGLSSTEATMSVADRVEFALNYLSDAKLKQYLNRLADELTEKGNLDGILLTGLTRRGIELLQCYVDITLDVQTTAITASFSSSSAVMKNPRVNEWVDGYRDLLDRWKLWHQRALFDNVRQCLVPDNKVNPQILVRCNFCGNSISPKTSNMSLMSKFRNVISPALPRAPQNKPKITCCHSCRKALPRCAICLTHMGTLSGVTTDSNSKLKSCPFDEWFSWCQTCRHGGHAGHMTEWFSEHGDCPVTGCLCNCMALDAVSQGIAQVPPPSRVQDDELTIKG